MYLLLSERLFSALETYRHCLTISIATLGNLKLSRFGSQLGILLYYPNPLLGKTIQKENKRCKLHVTCVSLVSGSCGLEWDNTR